MSEVFQGWFQRGAESMQNGDFAGAIDAYQQALAMNPNDPNVLFAIAVAFQYARRNEEAIAAYLKALAMDGQFFDAANNAAVLCAMIEQHDRAVEIYDNFLLHNRKHLDATVNLANMLVYLGRPEKAIEYYHDIIIMRPGHPVVAPNMSTIMALIGDGKKAINHLLRWVKNCPDEADAYYTAGFFLFTYAHDYAAAAEHYRMAAALQPDNLVYRRTYINSLQCAGLHQEAVEQAKLIDVEGYTLVSLRMTPLPAYR